MINLLPYKEKKIIERVRFIKMVNSVVIAFVLMVIISFVLLVPSWVTVTSRLNIVNNQILSLERDGKISSDIDLASLGSRSVVVQKILSSKEKISTLELIDIVRQAAPQGVSINRFVNEEVGKIQISGTSKSRELLQSFILELNKNNMVELVDNPVSNFIKNKNGTFNLTVSFKQ